MQMLDMPKFGWIPDKVDPRDIPYSTLVTEKAPLPEEVDLRSVCPPIYNQGPVSSCVGNATAAAIAFYDKKHNFPPVAPSRLFIYYNAREMEGAQYDDVGCSIRDAIKSVVQQGVCAEGSWPYLVENVVRKPYQLCYDEAIKNRVISYYRMDYVMNDFKKCLADGFPFTIGARLFENFPMATDTGIVPMPTGEVIGGHAMLVVGYSTPKKMFIIRNSWGEVWGEQGYGYLPFEYVINNGWSGDFWTIRALQPNTATTVPEKKECILVTLLRSLGL